MSHSPDRSGILHWVAFAKEKIQRRAGIAPKINNIKMEELFEIMELELLSIGIDWRIHDTPELLNS